MSVGSMHLNSSNLEVVMGVMIQGFQSALAKKLAGSKIPDARINELAKQVFVEGVKSARLDVCAYGICLDYLVDKLKLVEDLLKIEGVRRIEVFPYGQPVPDLFRAHVEVEVAELAQRATRQ